MIEKFEDLIEKILDAVEVPIIIVGTLMAICAVLMLVVSVVARAEEPKAVRYTAMCQHPTVPSIKIAC